LIPAATVTAYVVAGERGDAGVKVAVAPLGVTVPLTLGVSLKLVAARESAAIGLENVTLRVEFIGTLLALSAGLVLTIVGAAAGVGVGGGVLPEPPPQAAIQAMQRHV
jgi:hypothetical protein